MKGIVFTEFMEMVEQKFGYEMVDDLITKSDLESEGIYTAVGTYPYSDMVKLVSTLHDKTSIPIKDLLHTFGGYMFDTFTREYPDFFNSCSGAFEFLNSIDSYIHVQVLKLYPDAELPKFTTEKMEGNHMQLIYSSERKMSDFALGLLEKTFEFYGEPAEIEIVPQDENGKKVKFIISKK
jgi:hypothetical protein